MVKMQIRRKLCAQMPSWEELHRKYENGGGCI